MLNPLPENHCLETFAGRETASGLMVYQLIWGKSGACSFAAALEAALAVTDHPYTYTQLMGLSGLAFRVRWYRRTDEPDWCPSSPVGEFREESETLEKATGWRAQNENMMGSDNPRMERFTPDIIASIDAGFPVIGYPENLDVAVLYGYDQSDEDTVFLWEGFHWNEVHRLPATKTGPWIAITKKFADPLPYREALFQALTTQNWRRKVLPDTRTDRKASYLYGSDALQTWRNNIRIAETFSDEQRNKLFFVSWWCFTSLADARHNAASFLNDAAKTVENDARASLQKAASIYGNEGKLLGSVFSTRDAFLGPWSGKSIEDWTAQVRKREQKILTEIEKFDESAAAIIDKALAAMA